MLVSAKNQTKSWVTLRPAQVGSLFMYLCFPSKPELRSIIVGESAPSELEQEMQELSPYMRDFVRSLQESRRENGQEEPAKKRNHTM
jgi:hypothetical protein